MTFLIRLRNTRERDKKPTESRFDASQLSAPGTLFASHAPLTLLLLSSSWSISWCLRELDTHILGHVPSADTFLDAISLLGGFSSWWLCTKFSRICRRRLLSNLSVWKVRRRGVWQNGTGKRWQISLGADKSDRPIRSGKVVLGHFCVGIGCFKVPCYWHMVWDLIVCFLGVTPKWIRITCLAVLQAIKSKTSIPDLWVRDPVAMWKRPLLPRKFSPCVGDFRFVVKNV